MRSVLLTIVRETNGIAQTMMILLGAMHTVHLCTVFGQEVESDALVTDNGKYSIIVLLPYASSSTFQSSLAMTLKSMQEHISLGRCISMVIEYISQILVTIVEMVLLWLS